MEIVNQIAGSLAQSVVVTRQQSADKSRQIRRAQALRKDIATPGDSFEHKVESAEELTPTHDEQNRQPPSPRKSKPKPSHRRDGSGSSAGDAPQIDLTA
jgi:hypothetical protein